MANAILVRELINANHDGGLSLVNTWCSIVVSTGKSSNLHYITFDNAMMDGLLYLRFTNAEIGTDHLVFAGPYLKNNGCVWGAFTVNGTYNYSYYSSTAIRGYIEGSYFDIPANTVYSGLSFLTIQKFV